MHRDNAGSLLLQGLVKACGQHCPEATLNIISNPVNSTVPIAAETLKAMGVYDPKKLMGVTTLDVVRAKTFYAEKAKLDVKVRANNDTVLCCHCEVWLVIAGSRALCIRLGLQQCNCMQTPMRRRICRHLCVGVLCCASAPLPVGPRLHAATSIIMHALAMCV